MNTEQVTLNQNAPVKWLLMITVLTGIFSFSTFNFNSLARSGEAVKTELRANLAKPSKKVFRITSYHHSHSLENTLQIASRCLLVPVLIFYGNLIKTKLAYLAENTLSFPRQFLYFLPLNPDYSIALCDEGFTSNKSGSFSIEA